MNKFQAFVFDLDGLLIDSEPLWRRAEILILNDLGVGLTDDMCKQTMGLRLDEMVEYWYDRFPWQNSSSEEVATWILQEVTHLVKTEGEALPGAEALVRNLKKQHGRLAVSSSSPHSLIRCALKKLDLLDCFSAICSAENEELGKPHPGVYLSTAKELAVEPEECLALEDSLNGVKSARAAGMSVVAVPANGSLTEFPAEVRVFASLVEVENWLWLKIGSWPDRSS